MRKEGNPFGRDEGASPDEQSLSTEDIARTETEADAERMAPRTGLTESDRGSAAGPGPEAGTEAGTQAGPEAGAGAGAERGTSEQKQDSAPLLEPKHAEDLRFQWKEIQQGFVDDPQNAVRAADALVAEAMQLLATTFADHKHGLEGQWDRGEEVATEDLRVALRQYRSFFDRLLSA
jgi:hypothetical protein